MLHFDRWLINKDWGDLQSLGWQWYWCLVHQCLLGSSKVQVGGAHHNNLVKKESKSCISCSMQEHSLLEKIVREFVPFIPFSESLFLCVSLTIFVVVNGSLVYIYKQGWKSIHKKYKARWSKCKHMKGKPRPSKQ
jgi:hypothetical protein